MHTSQAEILSSLAHQVPPAPVKKPTLQGQARRDRLFYMESLQWEEHCQGYRAAVERRIWRTGRTTL